jgi:hypothetical protein
MHAMGLSTKKGKYLFQIKVATNNGELFCPDSEPMSRIKEPTNNRAFFLMPW